MGLYELDSPYGTHVSPRYLLSYNGVVLRRYETRYPSQQTARHVKIMFRLADSLSNRGYSRITLNCRSSQNDFRPFIASGWSASPQYTYVVPIGDLDLLWSRIEQNLRRLIKRCGGVRAENLCRLFHARLPNGQPIATQLVLLGPNPVTHTVTAAADPEFMRTGVTAFLRWKVFESVSAMGFSGNDLTGAGLNPVTHFKSQLGGDLRLFLALDSPRVVQNQFASGAEAMYRRGRNVLASVVRRVGLKKS
jgi:hypothetical protein